MSALRAVFVDTGAWVALRYRRDQYHGRAQKLAGRLEHERLGLVTTESVLGEAVTLLKARGAIDEALALGETIQGGRLASRSWRNLDFGGSSASTMTSFAPASLRTAEGP